MEKEINTLPNERYNIGRVISVVQVNIFHDQIDIKQAHHMSIEL